MTAISLTADLLAAEDAIAHGFFTKNGGVSEGFYASLNCGPGSKDNPEHVAENRRRAEEALLSPPPLRGRTKVGVELSANSAFVDSPTPIPTFPLMGEGERVCTLYQIHSAICHVIEKPFGNERPEGDAMATNKQGIILGILTADCAPVLFFDPVAKVIGAAHAGWRGAIGGVLPATMEAMQTLGSKPENIIAAIGPCAGWKSYEVDAAFKARFLENSSENEVFFKKSETNAEKCFFNLKGYVAAALAKCGMKHINILANDTISEVDRFFSFRRTTHAGEADYGRQLSAIMLR